MHRIVTLTLAMLFTTFALLGCDSEDGSTYDVTVAWQMSGISSCVSPALPDGTNLEFETIHIEVFGKDDTEALMTYDTPCGDYSFTIQNLKEGDYTVVLGAMATYDGDELPFFQATGEIEAPADEDEYIFQLMLGRGTVQASWGFEQGLCGPNGVTDVDIFLLGVMPNNEHEFTSVDCDDGLLLIEDVVWDSYQLTVHGYDEDGNHTHTGESEVFEVKPGETVTSDAFAQLLAD